MSRSIRIPDLQFENEELWVGHWLVERGQQIEVGDRLVELQIPGAVYVLAAEFGGEIESITQSYGEVVKVGDVIAWVAMAEGEDASETTNVPDAETEQGFDS